MNEPGYPNWSTFLFASQIQSVIWFLGIRILDQQMMIKSISFLLYCLAIYNKNQYLLSTYSVPDNVLSTGHVAVGSSHKEGKHEISKQTVVRPMLVWVMRKNFFEEETLTEF